ncbi:MAG TPA: cytochrome b/b6 domain-containing protein [Bryobacteraceae bacterium]
MPRHSLGVRVTHWLNALSFICLTVSGIAILLAHPRLYWGETGSVGTPSVIDLPLPFVLVGQSGWGRSLHFLAAWVCALTGLYYVFAGVLTRHFRRNLFPGAPRGYNTLQRLVYLAVIFALFPLMIWTGLAMSPGIVSVFPEVVTSLGGQQSARTIHFFGASLLVAFLFVHIAMVWRAGFAAHMRAMIMGAGKEDA